ncbi:MAG: hypothetical protein KAS95_07770 [Candidatus Heimdallarchaeota archaeon]|nr:hypothetical protein [Candidatus Heimdallarchaeota archaeon]
MSKPSITNDEVIRAGAEILLKGGVMLSKACPDCFSPLYKIQGKTLCVKCKKHFILVDTEQEMPKSSSPPALSSALPQTDSSYTKTQKIPFSYDFSNLPPELSETASILLVKLSELNKKLKETSNPEEISQLSSSIRSIIESLQALNS